MVDSDVSERKAEQVVFYPEPTLHRTPLGPPSSTAWKEVGSLEFWGALEPKDKMRYKLNSPEAVEAAANERTCWGRKQANRLPAGCNFLLFLKPHATSSCPWVLV